MRTVSYSQACVKHQATGKRRRIKTKIQAQQGISTAFWKYLYNPYVVFFRLTSLKNFEYIYSLASETFDIPAAFRLAIRKNPTQLLQSYFQNAVPVMQKD